MSKNKFVNIKKMYLLYIEMNYQQQTTYYAHQLPTHTR